MTLATRQHDGWAEVALSGHTATADLRAALTALADDPRQRVAMLTGDLTGLAGWTGKDSRWLWRDLTLPVVCAFDGHLAGDAAHIALAADVRICGAAASLAVPAGDRLQEHRLRMLTLATTHLASGDRFEAVDLLAMGLVSAVDLDVLAEGSRLCGVIASRGPIATRLAREAVWRGLDMPLEQGLRFETDLTLLLQTTKDRAEGVRAFMEKRAPQFEGD